MSMQLPAADKFMSRLFRRADGVVWDLMTGRVGIKSKDGIATLEGEGDDAQVTVNLLDQFGMEIPAFAQSTPIEAVNVGDIIYISGDRPAWVIDKVSRVRKPAAGSAVAAKKTAAAKVEPKVGTQFILMRADGQRTTWSPPKVQMLGLDSGVMVLRSLMSMLPGGANGLSQMQGMLMPMMMMGGDDLDLEKMMPMMLMSQVGAGDGAAPAAGNMMQMMFMMQMMKGKGGGSNPFSRG